MAFPLSAYLNLLHELCEKGYHLGPISKYFEGSTPPFVFLRHDVDRLPFRAVNMAAAENALGAASTYYFRCDAAMRFPEQSIRRIASLGHEVGFHYETVVRMRAEPGRVIQQFTQELAALRKIATVKTVTAHGSPLAKLSNVGYTKTLDLAEFGLIGDPAAGIDFSRVLYVTDTGGTYGSRDNLRDWSEGKNLRQPVSPQELAKQLDAQQEPLVVLSSHPERWPMSLAGLLQARMTDGLINMLKHAVNSRRRGRAREE